MRTAETEARRRIRQARTHHGSDLKKALLRSQALNSSMIFPSHSLSASLHFSVTGVLPGMPSRQRRRHSKDARTTLSRDSASRSGEPSRKPFGITKPVASKVTSGASPAPRSLILNFNEQS